MICCARSAARNASRTPGARQHRQSKKATQTTAFPLPQEDQKTSSIVSFLYPGLAMNGDKRGGGGPLFKLPQPLPPPTPIPPPRSTPPIPLYIVNLGSLRITSCKANRFRLLKGREGLMRTVSPIPHSLASSWAMIFLNVRFRTM